MKTKTNTTHTIGITAFLMACTILLLSCGGCRSGKFNNDTANKVPDIIHPIGSGDRTLPNDTIQVTGENLKSWHIHPDSAKAINERVFAEIKMHRIEPDEDIKYFTIDKISGEVHGCPLIKLIGQFDWRDDSLANALEDEKFKQILPKMENAWLGTKEIIVSEEFPMGHDRYPDYGFFSSNDEYIIVPDGDFHSGSIDRIYFFNSKGELLKNYKLDRTIEVPNMGLNREKTFFMLSSGVGPDFYFFYPDGRVFKKGNFHKITGDGGTSYGNLNISKTGKFWILKNNLAWIYDINGKLVNKLSYGSGNCILDENDKTVTYSYGGVLSIVNLENKKLLYTNIENDGRIINIISPSKISSYFKNDKNKIKLYEKVN